MKLLYTLIFAFFISCSTEPEVKDCAAVVDGSAIIDDCGLCTGGTTDLVANYLKDCLGECGGDSIEDCFGECNGDSIEDCLGECNGTAVEDDCGVCSGDNLTCTDCAGVINGIAYIDECGECDDNIINDCIQDCSGEWGGTSVDDACGICGGDNSTCSDCAGVPNGDNVEDNCGTCDSDSSNNCKQDCAGEWGGDLEDDECGVCGGDNSTCLGCDNVPNSGLVLDECGVCGGDNSPCTPIFDYDGNIYSTVLIGDQFWMAENLNTTHYNNGDLIISNSWSTTQSGAVVAYDVLEGNTDTYGRLYNWYAVEDERGVCPEGFHVPTDGEYMQLEMYLGMSEVEANASTYRGTNEGSKLAGGSELWAGGTLENNGAFGSSGFNAFPGGYRHELGDFGSLGYGGYFWTSSDNNSYNGFYRRLQWYTSEVYRGTTDNRNGFSVRCLAD